MNADEISALLAETLSNNFLNYEITPHTVALMRDEVTKILALNCVQNAKVQVSADPDDKNRIIVDLTIEADKDGPTLYHNYNSESIDLDDDLGGSADPSTF